MRPQRALVHPGKALPVSCTKTYHQTTAQEHNKSKADQKNATARCRKVTADSIGANIYARDQKKHNSANNKCNRLFRVTVSVHARRYVAGWNHVIVMQRASSATALVWFSDVWSVSGSFANVGSLKPTGAFVRSIVLQLTKNRVWYFDAVRAFSHVAGST